MFIANNNLTKSASISRRPVSSDSHSPEPQEQTGFEERTQDRVTLASAIEPLRLLPAPTPGFQSLLGQPCSKFSWDGGGIGIYRATRFGGLECR